jgi:hypothetical protein
MEKAIIVRGKMAGPLRVELEEPVQDLHGDVEVVLRSVEASPRVTPRDVFDLIASLPAGARSKEEIDQQIADERESWGDR